MPEAERLENFRTITEEDIKNYNLTKLPEVTSMFTYSRDYRTLEGMMYTLSKHKDDVELGSGYGADIL